MSKRELSPEVTEEDLIALRKSHEAQYKALPATTAYYVERFKEKLCTLVSTALNEKVEEVHLASVPKELPGDVSLQFRSLMKDMKTYMSEKQKIILDTLLHSRDELQIFEIETKGPFINIVFALPEIAKSIFSEIDSLKDSYGCLNVFEGKNLLVDYSSPNIGKSLHAGHIGTTFLGQVMCNIYEAAGYCVFRVNHLGDWGTPIGLVEVAEKEFGNDDEARALKNTPSQYYAHLYAKISQAQKDDESLRERAREFFAKLESGDKEARSFWIRLWKESVGELEKVYQRLGVVFDAYIGESFYESYLTETIEKILSTGVAKRDGQAVLVDYESKKMGVVLIVKSDGSTLYMARDVAALQKRKELFGLAKAVYVVGTEQSLHFRQLFEIGDEVGYMKKESCVHIPIGLLTKNGKKISSRTGGALAFEDLIDEVFERCYSIAKESLLDESDGLVKNVAEQVMLAALYFTIVQTSPGKNSEFDLEKITNTKGKSGPSLQYACVRAQSILNKVGEPEKKLSDISSDVIEKCLSPFRSLVFLLTELPGIVQSCEQANTAHHLAVYLDELASEFTHFIHSVRIKDAEPLEQQVYLLLVKRTRQVLLNGLKMLNIEVPERM